jgi:hypothetical protein
MKYVVLALTIALALVGCSKAREDAYVAGCKAGITEVVTSQGYQPKEDAIEKFCQDAAKKAS